MGLELIALREAGDRIEEAMLKCAMSNHSLLACAGIVPSCLTASASRIINLALHRREATSVYAIDKIHLGVGLKKFYRTSSSFMEGTSFDDRTVKHEGTAASRPVWPSYRVHDEVAHRNRVCEVYRQARPTFVAFARYLTSMLTEILDINER